jgi:sugar phosphate isomerase/epimerase
MAVAAAPLASAFKAQAKPDSNFGGVQVGSISYSFREMPDGNDAGTILPRMVELGLSGIELMNGPAEAWAGAPQKASAADLKAWRLALPMEKFKTLRKLYNDAGVNIYAFKLGLSMGMSDEEYAYTFNVAEALGANHITMELPTNAALTRRVGEYAAKRHIFVGYHAHTQATPTLWDEALSQSPYNAINLDLGHYTAGTNESPIPFLKKNHDRIVSMHLKDRKYEKNGGQNVPWGTGDTPLREALQLMKKEKYRFPATIELEYKIPEGSTVMAEMKKCVQFCKDALA